MTEKVCLTDAEMQSNMLPWFFLDNDTRARFQAWPYGWNFLGASGDWRSAREPSWLANCVYRARPAPLTQDVYPWEQIPKGMDWAARDVSGLAFTYAGVPVAGKLQWCSSGGDFARIDNCHVGYQRGTCHWKDSLQRRPEGM